MTTAYADLPAAMIGWLRSLPSVVSAFGEDTSALATTKFWGDEARPGVALPWAVYEEVEKSTMYMTAAAGVTSAIDEMTIKFAVVGEGKQAVRQLADALAKALTDPPLAWQGGSLMNFRPRNQFSVPVGDVAPGATAPYARVVLFDVMASRQV